MRQIGSIALSLCYLAIGAADVLVAAVQARSVDLAAGFLILREAGGGVAALDARRTSGRSRWTWRSGARSWPGGPVWTVRA